MSPPRNTPLTAVHERLGGRMVEFAGFRMPLQYTSIKQEHAAVRQAVGLFDVSHMGQIALRGDGAAAAADALLCRPVSDLATGRVRYALLCNEAGGVVDDITVYRRGAQDVMLCVNAANVAKDLAWIRANVSGDVRVCDESDDTGLLALQGPASAGALAAVGAGDTGGLKRFRFDAYEVAGRPALVSRTGYTGADGFEIYCSAADTEACFTALLAEGASLGLEPVGLGARDTLRLEAALPLYGHELDDETSPQEAGLGRFVDLEGRAFLGADAIRSRAAREATRTLVGFVLEDRGVARQGYTVTEGGAPKGRVTSGGPSPTLGKSIGLAYVSAGLGAVGTALGVVIRGRTAAARVVDTPFVTGRAAGRGAG